jgi:heparan-alpha-glucosaminide N-acetyltransferase
MNWPQFSGYLGPAGLADDNAYPGECIGGATGYVDRVILGENHIYSNPTAKGTYETGPFDPEGFLGKVLYVSHTLIKFAL